MEKGHSIRPDDCKTRWNVDSLHAHFERWLLNLEKHYDARLSEIKEATATALSAVEKQTNAAFSANKESVLKTEEGQKAYNAQHNDLTRKMESQANQFIGREKLDDVTKQFDAKLATIKEEIARLQEGISAVGVRRETQQEHRQTAQWGLGQVIATIGVLTAILVALIELLRNKP